MTDPIDHLLLKLYENHGWGTPYKTNESEEDSDLKTLISAGLLPLTYWNKPKVVYSTDECTLRVSEESADWPENLLDLLGVYQANGPDKEGWIIIFEECVSKFGLIYFNMAGIHLGQSRQTCINMVREIVLWHELGHWISHWMTDNNGHRWNPNSYHHDYGSKGVHEGLAQVFTTYAILNIDENQKRAEYLLLFNFMLLRQAPCYHIHLEILNHINYSWTGFLRSLVMLRILENSEEVNLEYLLDNLVMH